MGRLVGVAGDAPPFLKILKALRTDDWTLFPPILLLENELRSLVGVPGLPNPETREAAVGWRYPEPKSSTASS